MSKKRTGLEAINENIESAMQKYSQLNEDNTKAALDINKEAVARATAANRAAAAQAMKEQRQFQDKLKKTDVYGNAFKQASRTAEGQAQAAGAQAQSAARQAGMSKAAAAEAGANARQGALSGAMGQQQQSAMGAQMQKLGMQQQGASEIGRTAMQAAGQEGNVAMGGAGNAMNAYSNQIANQGNLVGMQQAEAQNVYDRKVKNVARPFDILGGIMQAFPSDENLKDAEKNNDSWKDVDAILKKHQGKDFKKLIIVREEK